MKQELVKGSVGQRAARLVVRGNERMVLDQFVSNLSAGEA
jgi:hypothetical protein